MTVGTDGISLGPEGLAKGVCVVFANEESVMPGMLWVRIRGS
jgi:hypothetical protein